MNKQEIVELVNQERTDNSLPILTENNLLNDSAQERADYLCTSGNWSHDGWEDSLTYDYLHAGENLAKNHDTENITVQAWINSPTHHENILDDYTETGIGYKECGENTYTVQHFGSPMPEVEAMGYHFDFILPALAILSVCVALIIIKLVRNHLKK